MQPPFPTKKFFLVLLFLAVVAGGTFKFFGFIKHRAATNTLEEQKISLIRNEVLPRETNISASQQNLPIEEAPVSTTTLNAVAAVIYLNEQTKANGTTMEEITTVTGKQIVEAKKKLDADAYTKNDIVIDIDNSPEALKKYGNDMAGIFSKYGKEKQAMTYLEIIKKSLEENDPKVLKKLDPYITFEKNVIKDALVLKVPSTLATAHLHIINASAEMLLIFQGFQATFEDVPSAIASNSRLEKSAHRLLNSFKEAGEVFVTNNVIFFPSEDGSIFTNAAKLVK